MSEQQKSPNPFELFQQAQKQFSELQKEGPLSLEKIQEAQKQFTESLQKIMPNVDLQKQQQEFSKLFSAENIQKQVADISAFSQEAAKDTMNTMETMKQNINELMQTMTNNPVDFPTTVFKQQTEAVKSFNRKTENFLEQIIQKSQKTK